MTGTEPSLSEHDLEQKLQHDISHNSTFRSAGHNRSGWISKGYYGLDQGPIVMMIENYRSEFIWRLMRKCTYIVKGLRRAGFSGGWLDSKSPKTA